MGQMTDNKGQLEPRRRNGTEVVPLQASPTPSLPGLPRRGSQGSLWNEAEELSPGKGDWETEIAALFQPPPQPCLALSLWCVYL